MAATYIVSGTMKEMVDLLGSKPFSRITELEIDNAVFTNVKVLGLSGKNDKVNLFFTAS
jgi:hypothetical protein